MKKIIIALSLLLSTSAIAGSNNGHIFFQSAGTFVNPVTSKSLCFDGTNFKAMVPKCTRTAGRDGDSCVRWSKKQITQPAESTRMVCANDDARGACQDMMEVRFYQSPVRTVTFEADRGGARHTTTIRVPSCN